MMNVLIVSLFDEEVVPEIFSLAEAA